MAIDLPSFTADLARIRWVRRRRRTTVQRRAGDAAIEEAAADPVVLVFEERHGRRVVRDSCSRARDRGVRPGLVLAEAMALVHGEESSRSETRRRGGSRTISPSFSRVIEPIVVPVDPDRAHRALSRLAVGCLRFAPVAAVDGSRGIILDIGGCDRWLAPRGGESGLLDRIETTFRRAGFEVRTAIAGTVVAARAWAGWRPASMVSSARHDHRRVPDETIWPALDPLPVSCLDLDPAIVERLHQVNVRCVGDLRRLPRTALPSRYGPVVHRRLDQVVGRGGDAFHESRVVPVRAADRIVASRAFGGPVRSRETIELAVVDLVGRLHDRLRIIASGARILRLVAERVDAPDWIDQIELARATRRPAHLWSVLEPLVDRLPLDHGIDALSLEAARHRRLRDRAAPLVHGAVDDGEDPHVEESFAAFVDLVQARFGDEALRRHHPAPGHAPEDRMRLQPFGRSLDERDEPTRRIAVRGAISSTGPRPTTWLDRPEPLEVEVATDGDRIRPIAIHWRGRRHEVAEAVGPEPIGAPWWRRPLSVVAVAMSDPAIVEPVVEPRRDYWGVRLDEGAAFWIFHASSTGRWFMQGVWS